MEKLKKLKVVFSITFLTLLLFMSAPIHSDSFRILYISSPNQVKCDTERKFAGDTIFSDNKLMWMNDKQAMRVQNLSNGEICLCQQNPSSPRHNMTVGEYIKGTRPMTGRGDTAHTSEALRALIPDTLLLLDKIEIPTTLSQNRSQFFFIEYLLKGELIKKQLHFTEKKLTIDRDIYTIDGEELPAFTTPINIYYYDKNANTISIIGENKIILPLSL